MIVSKEELVKLIQESLQLEQTTFEPSTEGVDSLEFIRGWLVQVNHMRKEIAVAKETLGTGISTFEIEKGLAALEKALRLSLQLAKQTQSKISQKSTVEQRRKARQDNFADALSKRRTP